MQFGIILILPLHLVAMFLEFYRLVDKKNNVPKQIDLMAHCKTFSYFPFLTGDGVIGGNLRILLKLGIVS